MLFEFIFYVILFYFIIKSLNALTRWWKKSSSGQTKQSNMRGNNYQSKYSNIEEAEFTEIESHPNKDKVQE